ncbi:MAG: RNA polymerase sigma-70 factor [Bacteroidota bacterium]
MNGDWSSSSLLDAIARGEESAFRHLFDNYYQSLVTFAFHYMRDLDASRNVVQDVFVMLYDKREEIKIHTSLKAHLYQSVRNRALNAIKRDKMQREHHHRMLEEDDEHLEHEDYGALSELEGRIAKVVDDLPGQCKKIFRMSRREGIPNAEIAEQLSISKRTVETQISKALKKIREDLVKHGYLPVLLLLANLLKSFFI